MNKRTLKQTQGILQRAHDYFEAHGFNISEASEKMGEEADFKKGRKGKADLGYCCFIGGVRLAAGVNPEGMFYGTDSGDGPELTLALEILDEVAKRSKHAPAARAHALGSRADQPGGLVEGLGFALKDQGLSKKQQQARAIGILRSALRDVHKKLEAKKK